MTTWKHFCLSRQFPLRFPRCFFSPSHPFTYCYFLGVSTASHSPQLVSVTAQLWGTSLFFISSSAVFLKFITEVFFFFCWQFLVSYWQLKSWTSASHMQPTCPLALKWSHMGPPIHWKVSFLRSGTAPFVFIAVSQGPISGKWRKEAQHFFF